MEEGYIYIAIVFLRTISAFLAGASVVTGQKENVALEIYHFSVQILALTFFPNLALVLFPKKHPPVNYTNLNLSLMQHL